MSPAITPEQSGVCAQTCGHAGCAAVRQFAAIPCALCGEPIGYAAEFLRRAGWRLLAHRGCVRADVERWTRIGPEEVAP